MSVSLLQIPTYFYTYRKKDISSRHHRLISTESTLIRQYNSQRKDIDSTLTRCCCNLLCVIKLNQHWFNVVCPVVIDFWMTFNVVISITRVNIKSRIKVISPIVIRLLFLFFPTSWRPVAAISYCSHTYSYLFHHSVLACIKKAIRNAYTIGRHRSQPRRQKIDNLI